MSFDIPLLEPNMSGGWEHTCVAAAIDGNEPTRGDYVKEFEELVASATGRVWCVALCSGTAALHTALLALGTGKDHVLAVPSFTFAATVNAIIYTGAAPYFVDIDENWVSKSHPDGDGIYVEVNGNPAPEGATIVDAAHSMGRGKIGGRLACLSFNGNKIITTGGGGAVIGDDPELEARVRYLANQCTDEKYKHGAIGLNYRMPNINAAIGVAQMQRLYEFVAKKKEIQKIYLEELPYEPLAGNGFWLSGYITDNAGEHIDALQAMGIEAQPFFHPLHLQAPYKDYPRDELPNTEAIYSCIVTLPSSTTLTEEQQQRVIDAVLSLPVGEQTPRRSSA
jgi:dTDP-4-amino-4,6-dideoxygalactose transaminase